MSATFVVTTGPVLQELLQGFAGPKARAQIIERFPYYSVIAKTPSQPRPSGTHAAEPASKPTQSTQSTRYSFSFAERDDPTRLGIVKQRRSRATCRKSKMANTVAPAWDRADHLQTAEDMAAYLVAAPEEGDPTLVAAALGDMARAKIMTQVARHAGPSTPRHTAHQQSCGLTRPSGRPPAG